MFESMHGWNQIYHTCDDARSVNYLIFLELPTTELNLCILVYSHGLSCHVGSVYILLFSKEALLLWTMTRMMKRSKRNEECHCSETSSSSLCYYTMRKYDANKCMHTLQIYFASSLTLIYIAYVTYSYYYRYNNNLLLLITRKYVVCALCSALPSATNWKVCFWVN